MKVEKLLGGGRLVGNMGRAGHERSMIHLKKSKLPGTEKTRMVVALLDRWAGPDHVGLIGHESLGLFLRAMGAYLKVLSNKLT